MLYNLGVLKRLLRESGSASSLLGYCIGYFIHKALARANHNLVHKWANIMIKFDLEIGHYYLALSDFLCGNLDSAEIHIKKISQYEQLSDVVYLYADILVRKEEKAQAQFILEKLACNHSRKKTWIYLSNLVSSELDFKRFIYLIDEVKQKTNFIKNDDLAIPIANAALRANLPIEALKIWEARTATENYVRKRKAKSSFSDRLAKQALSDLKKVFDFNRIEFFLISGTLLGCIREQKLLSHDKDIDIGVWDTYSYKRLTNIFSNSGYFYIVPTRTKELIMLRHVNGITIDVFIHHREKNNYWHAGVKLKWNNSPFELTETEFLDGIYLIPKDYDLYLTENYGDWKTPKTNFDSAFDTPNAEVINQSEMDVYLLRNK